MYMNTSNHTSFSSLISCLLIPLQSVSTFDIEVKQTFFNTDLVSCMNDLDSIKFSWDTFLFFSRKLVVLVLSCLSETLKNKFTNYY